MNSCWFLLLFYNTKLNILDYLSDKTTHLKHYFRLKQSVTGIFLLLHTITIKGHQQHFLTISDDLTDLKSSQGAVAFD